MTILRFLVGDVFFLFFFGGSFFSEPTVFSGSFFAERMEFDVSSGGVRKKLAGGGVSGALSLGGCRLAIGCGSRV